MKSYDWTWQCKLSTLRGNEIEVKKISRTKLIVVMFKILFNKKYFRAFLLKKCKLWEQISIGVPKFLDFLCMNFLCALCEVYLPLNGRT